MDPQEIEVQGRIVKIFRREGGIDRIVLEPQPPPPPRPSLLERIRTPWRGRRDRTLTPMDPETLRRMEGRIPEILRRHSL